MRLKILLIVLLLFHLFFMFYNLEKWASFGWDQVDNAWAAMRIVSAHKYPLLGMVAKQNSGIYIGPLYYYFAALFYFITRMDPIASPIIAGATSLFSFAVIYFVAEKIFNRRTALVSCFIYTFSSFVIMSERVQWPVNFIAPVSLLIFYFLHLIISGQTKYFLHLGALIGLSFHLHFTAVFYPVIVIAALPFVRWKKTAFKYMIVAAGITLLFFIPQIIYYLQSGHGLLFAKYGNYAESSYHGLHLRRVIQLIPDAFIKFQSILMNPYGFVRNISYIFVPSFVLLYRKKISYLLMLWFLLPWIILSTYSGEISDYYFSIGSYLAIIVLACLTVRIWDVKSVFPKALALIFWLYWGVANVHQFFQTNPGELQKARAEALTASKTSRIIPFTEGDPKSYLYYYYMKQRGGWVPYKL